MSDEEFYEQFHRKGGDYLIPDRVFEDLLYEKEELEKKLNELQKPQIFIDTQDIEERYGEGKYQDYLEEQVKNLTQKNEELKKELDEMLDENLKLSELWCECKEKIRESEEAVNNK